MDNKKLQQTRRRLTLVFTGVVFVIVVLIGLIFIGGKYYGDNRAQERDFLFQVQDISQKMKRQENFFEKFSVFQSSGDRVIFSEFRNRERLFSGEEGISFILIDENKKILHKHILEEPKFDDIDFDKQRFYRDDGFFVAVRKLQDNTAIFYAKMRNPWGKALDDVIFLFILAAISSGFFYYAGYQFVGRTLRPVQENLQDMQDFIHHAGHELKTPLAVIRGNLQIMKSEKELDMKLVKDSIKEIDTSNNLIEGLREIAETGKLREKESYAFAPEVARVVSELSSYAKQKKVHVENTAQGSLIVRANISELHILLKNLIQNAIKYSPEGSQVELLLQRNIFTVCDTGKGITQKEQKKIFNRFYKGTEARSEEGFGIGLALVKKICDANGWKIELESEEKKGSEFRIIF